MKNTLLPRIKDIVELVELKDMVAEFTAITGLPFTLLDLDGTILIHTGGPDICTCFHQPQPIANARCTDSRNTILENIDLEAPYSLFHCKNGMTQAACPVLVNKQYVACIVMCHFLDQPPNLTEFRERAIELELDEAKYIHALKNTPVYSKTELEHIMTFYSRMATMIGKYGFQKKQLRELIDIQSDLNHRLNSDISVRKETEERLRERERQMATLFDNLPGMAYRCSNDHNWTMTFASEGVQELCGYLPDDIVNSKTCSWNDIIHPEDREELWTSVQSALVAKQPYLTQYRIITRDGIIRHVWEKGRGIYRDDKLEALEGFIMDISDEYLAKRQLSLNKQRFKLFAENARDILYRMSLPDCQYEFISAASERITGYPVEEFYNDPSTLEKHLHPDSVDYIRREREKLLEDKNIPPSYEFKIIAKDGSTKWLHQRNAIIRDDTGKPIAIEGIVTDLTELKEAQKALKENEALLRASQIAGKIGNWELNLQTLRFHSSPYTRQLAHITPQLPDGPASLDDFILSIHSEDRARIAAKVKNSLLTHVGFEDEWRLQSDGTRYVRAIAKVETNQSTGHTRCWGTLQDVSGQRSIDKQMTQSQKMDAAEHLAGGIAHDFNNLLHAINGYAELIGEQASENPDIQHNIRQLTLGTEKARVLTDKLLAFSRKENFSPEPLDLNEFIKQTLPLLNNITGPECTILFNGQPNLHSISADHEQLKQVLINLCLNSHNAMPNGGMINIHTHNQTLDERSCQNIPDQIPGEYVVLTVEDDGCGIAPNIIDKIFDPLFTTSKRGKGTGLGLAITYTSVKAHNGQITATNRAQGGALFTISIPATLTAAENTEPVEDSIIPGGGTETILLAEDDELVCKVSEDILARMGYRLIIAHDGKEAVDLFMANKDNVDLLVLDIVMPNINGSEVYNIIAKEKPSIPVLFCSGYNEDVLRSNFLLSVPGMMIHKPYSNKELLHSVRLLLNN